ncbi:MAG: hypothetical protein FD167_5303, partial [bacterium]
MPNPRFLQTTKRRTSKKIPADAIKQHRKKTSQPTNVGAVFPDKVEYISIFSYDGEHGEFYQELIAKANERFRGTAAEIIIDTYGQVKHMYSWERFGLITAIYNDLQLRSHKFWPITAIQSEHLMEAEVLTNNDYYWEVLGLVLYDVSKKGYNPKEAKALRDSLKKHRQDLGLKNSDLEKRLIVVSPGLEKDPDMPHGAKPIVLPGVTQTYTHEVLEKARGDHDFEGYGLKGGLPLIEQLEKGDRTLHMP